MKSVYSSWVSEIGYDVDSQELVVVTQNGARLVYVEVPPETAASVMSAASIGEALHAEIRGKFGHSQ